jgi:hypothetical protein
MAVANQNIRVQVMAKLHQSIRGQVPLHFLTLLRSRSLTLFRENGSLYTCISLLNFYFLLILNKYEGLAVLSGTGISAEE